MKPEHVTAIDAPKRVASCSRGGWARAAFAASILTATALLAGCGNASAKPNLDGSGSSTAESGDVDGMASKGSVAVEAKAVHPALPVTVESADGSVVEVTDISRIVVLRGPIAEVVYSLGLGEKVVGRDVSTTFVDADEVPVVTHGHDLSAESVMSLRPSVVLADSDSGPPEALAQLRAVGVPVVVFHPVTSIDGIRNHITKIAEALGVPAAGKALATRTMKGIEVGAGQVADLASPPKVAFLYLRGTAGVYLLGGPGSGADSMIEAAGGIDVGTEMDLGKAFTPLTSEALVAAAPEVFLLTTTGLESVGGMEGLLATPGIAQTPAGRNRRVITIEDGLLYSFGPRTPSVVKGLASRFAEVME
ncbi:MAG TPA: ABC transporter substrate-binding protein [Microthrixaceae bacterium]|nr:ABC transporter substrate-binding protein [Microthrixaceae bacterium]